MKQELSNNKYLSKRLKLEEIKNPQHFFKLWAESNLVKFLIRLFFNKENFIKLFDFRIISSLILRDLYSSKTNKSSILNTFLLIILSILFYRLSNKAIIEKKHLNLVKIVYGHINCSKYKEKKLEESFNEKNISTFTNYYFSKIFYVKKKKEKYSIVNTNLKKEIYFKPIFTYNKCLIEDSKWWKLWIIKEILPSWKISSSSIKEIDNLLKEKNTDDLKYFFEFYMDNIVRQNYDWENKFNFIFRNNSKNKTKLKFIQNKKILGNTLILQIFSAFCKKLVFEVESPLKLNNLNSTIKLDKNNNFFSIPIFYKKKVNPELFYLLKKNLIQNCKFLSEADPIIVKYYIFIKKKGWGFFKNYAEFYLWKLYKKNLLQYKKNLNKIDTNKNKLKIKLFNIESLYNKKKNLKIDKNFSKISYQMSKYILYKVKNSNKLTNNYKIINKNFKLKRTNETKIKKTLNLIETNCFQSNKNLFEYFLHKRDLNNEVIKQNVALTIWDIYFFGKNEKNKIKSNLFFNPFFKSYLIVWIKNLFIEKKRYITNNFFIKNKKNFKFNCNSFLNILSIDELNMGLSITKKYKINFEVIKKQQKKFFRHFLKSDNNKLVFLWKVKKKNQKLNSFIFLDYAFKIISERKYNKNNLFLIINSKSPTNIFYLLWSFIYKYISIANYNKNIKFNKNLFFEINYFINLAIFLDKLNLLVIKYNLFDNKITDYNINYRDNKNYKLKKKLVITNFFPKSYSKITNNSKLIKNNFYKNLTEFLNSLFLINKIFYNNKKIYLKNRKKTKINQILLNCKKKRKNAFYYNTIRKNIYIYWKCNKNSLIDKKSKNKKIVKFCIKKQKNLLLLSNQIDFVNNKNSIVKWSNKLNKKNIYIFYKTFLLISHTNFIKISKLFIFSQKNSNISKKKFQEKNLNKNNLLEQVKFNIYYKLKTNFYFDKILIIKFLINYFNDQNNQIYTKSFNNIFCFLIWQNQEIHFNFLKISNKNLINSLFFKVDTLKLLNFLYYSDLSYKKKLKFYLKKNKKNNLTYTQLIKNIPIEIEKKKNLSINQLPFFYKKKKKILNIESKIYKTFLSKYLKKFNYKKLIFLQDFNLNKLLDLTNKFNPVFYEKKKNLGKNIYIQKPLEQNNNSNQTISCKNYLLSKFFVQIQNENNQIVNWINKLFIMKSNSKIILINTVLNENKNNIKINYEKNKIIVSFFAKNYNKLISQKKIFKTSNFFVKWIFFEKYIPWFFTLKWWKYFQNLISNLFSELLLNINDQFNYILLTTSQNRKKKLNYLLKNLLFNLNNKFLGNSFEIWNLRLLKQINKQYKNQESEWSWLFLNLINRWNRRYLTTISLIIFGYFIFQKYFSTLLGSDYFELWGYFEIIRYLIDSSRGIYLDDLTHNNSIKFIKSENLLINFFNHLKHYLKNAKFYLFIKKKINKLLINNKGLDLSRREQKLLVQSLITDKSISEYRLNLTSNTNFISFQFGNQIVKQHKLKNYLENLTENYQKNLINYPFHKFYLAENLVFLSFWKKTTSLYIPGQFDISKSGFYKKPVPLELRFFSSKGILLIGSLETGRSYLVKNIAANSFVPLIKISINKLLYNKPDILTESWMNILMESLRRLNLILELAEKLSPCIIWMQNIHELNVNRSTQNVESDPTFLLGIFLKYFQTAFRKKYTTNIVIIGSTHLPKKVDPALISPNRLDRLINIRMFNILQRQKKISILLHSKYSKYFYSKNKKSCINEFGYRTMGYNARDLAGLINEISLINITQNQTIIEKKIIRLAFHRQILGSTYINNKLNFTQNYGILFYKVGKVIIQNLFLENSSKNPLYFGNDLWKKKFYYLSKWYLEPSIFESTIKEFTILPYILGCLAGLAARDSWSILENKPDNLISLDKAAENDFYLACGILESLLIEFSWLETFEKKNTNKKKILNFQFQTKNPLYMIKKGLFSQNIKNKLLNKSINQTISYKKELYQLTSNITWAPKISRLNFIRTNLFNWINRPNQFEVTYNFNFLKKKEKKNFTDSSENSHFFEIFEIIQHKTKEQLPYERILSRIRRRNVQELEFQLEDILLEEQFIILGFSQLFTEYRMESQLSSKPMIFIGGRFLWDPTGLLFQNNNFIFSRQKLFIDEEILRRLYVTYGARREREKSRSSQKIKQFFLRRGYGRNSVNGFSINWWNQLPFIEKNNVETFKRIEGIGVQLKRPQVFTPVYLYQRWLIENPREKLIRFDLLNNQQRWLKVNNILLNDSFIYNTLLEIYQYLFKFFISHQVLLNEMTEILLKNKWLFHNEIEYFINILNKRN
uniref:Protein Ycf2 n=1 Tax=Fissidens nobilis TaxID=2008595 RepID=A0A516TBT2_FISNO|nr:Ycf2 [Fissidens nobilis]QDQ38638.1 Ycf2 [Fissidens nobilis]